MTGTLPWGPSVVQVTTGPRGVQGPRGTRWTIGSGSPPPLPPDGRVGDIWLDVDTGNVHQATSSAAWALRGSIRGPDGLPGPVTFEDLNGAISTLEQQLGVDIGNVSDALTALQNSLGAAAYLGVGSGAGLLLRTDGDGSGLQNLPASGVKLAAIRVYEASGSPHTWTKPAGLDHVLVIAIGGGGGGSGYGSSHTPPQGSGGAAASVGYGRYEAIDLGATEDVTVGNGGGGGASGTGGNSGGNGGTSSFGTHLSVPGGPGGTGPFNGGAAGLNPSPAVGGYLSVPGQGGARAANSLPGEGGSGQYGIGGSPIRPPSGPTGYGSGGSGAAGTGSPGISGRPGLVLVCEYVEA